MNLQINYAGCKKPGEKEHKFVCFHLHKIIEKQVNLKGEKADQGLPGNGEMRRYKKEGLQKVITLIKVMVSWVYTCVKTYQTVNKYSLLYINYASIKL